MIKHLLKPLSFIPAILMMYLIFNFSAMDGEASSQLSYKVSYKLVEIGAEILDADFEIWEIENLAVRFQGPIRKIAHMAEYCALAVCISFPLYVYGLRGIWLMLVAGVLCVGFACTDEYHQAFVEGRGPSKKDVLIDSFGVFTGIIFVRILGWIGRHTIFRSINRKKHHQKPIPVYVDQPEYSVYPPPERYQPQEQEPHYNNYPQNHYQEVSYTCPHFPDEEEEYISDQLSEDMSFKKLLRDLKEQRKQ